ncbi:MAG TPA: tetrahydrofolate dehydrogenase/cyclohydrolase catalytic domain-containing protein, partial [Acidimicrobiales bacterium]|nr:tetrahydrofolate dehydrogenase/cyclohydrolase catalytic domain-containing protein [Acidimicrobiales bacterium]
MSATRIDGEAVATELRGWVSEEVAVLQAEGVSPGLATVLVGEDYAARAYEARLARLARAVGCWYVAEELPADACQADALAVVGKLNADPRVSGVLVLRPLPPQISEVAMYSILDPGKDIESIHPLNAGLLALGRPRFVPSTPASCFCLLDAYLRSSGRDPEAFYARSTLVSV